MRPMHSMQEHASEAHPSLSSPTSASVDLVLEQVCHAPHVIHAAPAQHSRLPVFETRPCLLLGFFWSKEFF